MTTPLLHLGLLVRDQQRSLRFYATYYGFDPAGARRYPDGTVIVRNAQCFDLALHPGDPQSGSRPSCTSGSSSPTPTPWGPSWLGWKPTECRSWSAGTSRAMWPSSASTRTAGE